MKKILFFALVAVCFHFYSNAQTVTDTTWTSFSGTVNKWHDSIPDTSAEQRMGLMYQMLDTSYIPTHILIDRTISFINLNSFIGDTSVDSLSNYGTILGILNVINGSAVDTSHKPFESVISYDGQVQSNLTSGYIPLTMLDVNYNTIDSNAIDSNLLRWIGKQLQDVPGRPRSPYWNRNVFTAAPAALVYNSNAVNFLLPPGLFLTNSSEGTPTIKANFGDGTGFHTVIAGTPIHINFPTPGTYYGSLVDSFPGFPKKQSHFIMHVKGFTVPTYGPFSISTWTIAPSAGRHSGGVVTIALSCDNDKLTKPLIVAKGFDPLNQLNFYSFLSDLDRYKSGLLAQEINLAGYDIVYVNYNNNTDSIERNARLLEDVINRVNTTKAANGSTEHNVVLGESMGGLVSRWCLRTMENAHTAHPTDPVHDVSLFISFDSPQRGAYTPVAAEYLMDQLYYVKPPFEEHLRYTIVDPDDGTHPVIEFYNFMTSPAANEMLLYLPYDFKKDNPMGNFVIDQHHGCIFTSPTNFIHNLDLLGYPQNCRNVAIANGSQTAQNQGYPGPLTALGEIWGNSDIWGHNLVANADITLHGLPDRSNLSYPLIYNGRLGFTINTGLIFAFYFNLSFIQVQVNKTDALENAPGGVYDIGQFVTNNNTDVKTLIQTSIASQGFASSLPYTSFCFIPTVSSLDVDTSVYIIPTYYGPYYNVQSGNIVATSHTEFKNYVAPDSSLPSPDVNELHVSFTGTNRPLFESELHLLSGHINSVDTNFVFVDTSYNFGANTSSLVQTSDRIGNSEFTSSTSLLVNEDSTLGLSTSGWPNPTHGSNFSVYTAGAACGGPVTVTIDAGARMIVGNSTYSNTGSFFVDSADNLAINGSLIMNPGCHIFIQKGGVMGIGMGIAYPSISLAANCSITVLDGGELDYGGGAINLNDTSAKIEIQGSGKLYVYGDTFKLSNTSSGYIEFNTPSDAYRNLSGAGGGAFFLKGSSSAHKVLEVTGGGSLYPGDGSSYPNEISYFGVSTGKIILGSNSRLNIGCPVTLNKVHITSSSGSYNGHRGLNLYGQSGVNIDSVNITNGDYGVYAPLFYGGHSVIFRDLSVSGCGTGVYTDGETATFEDTCNISNNNGNGWNGDNMNSARFEQSIIGYTLGGGSSYDGMNVNGSTEGANITLGQSNINYMDIGCYGDNCTLIIDTCDIVNNGTSIEGVDAVLCMGVTYGGGFSNLSGTTAINVSGSTDLYLDGGYNNLIPGYLGYSINANLNYCPYGGVASYSHNLWNISGTAPVSGTYIADGSTCSGGVFTITDPSPLTSFTAYSALYTGPTDPIDRLQLIDKEFDQFPTGNAALTQQIFDGMLAAQLGQYPTEARTFNQCVNEYLNMGHPIDELAHRMYNKLIEGVQKSLNDSELTAHDPFIDSVITTQDLLVSKMQAPDEYFIRYGATLDKAGLKRAQNKRLEALQILENLETWADTSKLKHLQYMHCVINAEQAVVSRAVPKEKFQELVKNCIRDIPQPTQVNTQMINKTSENVSKSEPVIYPNPAGSNFNISLLSEGNSELNATVIDVNGKVVYSSIGTALIDGQNVISYPVTGLQPGVYVIHLVYNNGKDYREKIVIQNE